MDRRNFSMALGAAALAQGLPRHAMAQGPQLQLRYEPLTIFTKQFYQKVDPYFEALPSLSTVAGLDAATASLFANEALGNSPRATVLRGVGMGLLRFHQTADRATAAKRMAALLSSERSEAAAADYLMQPNAKSARAALPDFLAAVSPEDRILLALPTVLHLSALGMSANQLNEYARPVLGGTFLVKAEGNPMQADGANVTVQSSDDGEFSEIVIVWAPVHEDKRGRCSKLWTGIKSLFSGGFAYDAFWNGVGYGWAGAQQGGFAGGLVLGGIGTLGGPVVATDLAAVGGFGGALQGGAMGAAYGVGLTAYDYAHSAIWDRPDGGVYGSSTPLNGGFWLGRDGEYEADCNGRFPIGPMQLC